MSERLGGGPVRLQCEHLAVQRGSRTVVRDVTFDLANGEVVALLGPNGAGKSTLLDAIVGTLASHRGTILRSGRVAIALQSADLARRSVLANVLLALSWWGVPRDERPERARGALRALAVEHLADRPAGALSGGERRRVHLARVLAVQPDILLLDEPFAGLDAQTRSTLLEDTVSVLRSGARATLVVVHDRAEAWALADRLLIMIDGELVASGEPRALLSAPPTPTVARFLGYDGELGLGEDLLLTRPADVTLDEGGELTAQVTRATALEDGVRLELSLDDGRLYVVAPVGGPRVGDTVRVAVRGGARFARAGGER